MGDGGPQNSTVTNRTDIDPVTQAWRSNIMGAGGQLYNQGTPAPYPNSQVVPFSDQTQSGLNYLQQYAQGGATNLGAANDAQSRALSGWNPAMPMAANAAMGGLQNNPAMQGLSQYGQGVNPGLSSLFQQGAGQIADAVNGNFMQAGRFGGNAAHSGAMTREIGNLWNQINVPAWEQERNRGLTAQQTMGSLYDSGANRTLQGIDMFGGMNSQANADAARATALQPSLYAYGMQPGQNMLDVGGMYEQQAGNYLQDDVNRYNQPYQSAWDHLQNYAGLMSGLPDFSSSAQTTTQPGPNRLMQGLGAASSIASMFAAFGGSDVRIKQDIAYVGTDERGHRWYDFHYIGEDKTAPLRLGVMAQEVMQISPGAVSEHPLGFLCVNYGAL